jgi:hypothetical protein
LFAYLNHKGTLAVLGKKDRKLKYLLKNLLKICKRGRGQEAGGRRQEAEGRDS